MAQTTSRDSGGKHTRSPRPLPRLRATTIVLREPDRARISQLLADARASGRRGWTQSKLLRFGLQMLDGAHLPHAAL